MTLGCAWSSAQSLSAREYLSRLDRRADPETVRELLDQLVMAGDSKAAALAITAVLRDGPAVAARAAASVIDLSRSTRTSALAELKMLAAAGDVLEPEAAASGALAARHLRRRPCI